jgi:hypothetical protein
MATTLAKTKYQQMQVLNTMRGTAMAAWAPYLALSSTDFGEDGAGGTEPTDAAYDRVAITCSDPDASANDDTCQSVGATRFATATENWSDTPYAGVFDAVSGGHCRYHGTIDKTVPGDWPIETGSYANFAAGTILLSEK